MNFKSRMFKMQYVQDSQVFQYNMPQQTDPELTVQCAIDLSTIYLLETFATSLTYDGHDTISDVIDSNDYRNYLDHIVEASMVTTLTNLEHTIYDDVEHVSTFSGSVVGGDIYEYLSNNAIRHHIRMRNLAQFILLNVISSLVTTLRQLEIDGVHIDTFTMGTVAHDKTTLNVSCFIDTTKGLSFNV